MAIASKIMLSKFRCDCPSRMFPSQVKLLVIESVCWPLGAPLTQWPALLYYTHSISDLDMKGE